MAVETRYGSLVMANVHEDTAAIPTLPSAGLIGGRVRTAIDTVEIVSGDSVASRYFFARLPSDAILLPQSEVHFDDAGTSVTLDIGDVNDPDGLATDINIASAAGSSTLLEAVDIANIGKKLWELLGYTADPKTQIDLYATLAGAAAGANATLTFIVLWAQD